MAALTSDVTISDGTRSFVSTSTTTTTGRRKTMALTGHVGGITYFVGKEKVSFVGRHPAMKGIGSTTVLKVLRAGVWEPL